MKSYFRTDLAIDNIPKKSDNFSHNGVDLITKSIDGIEIVSVTVKSNTSAKELKRKKGKYTTLCFDKDWVYDDKIKDNLAKALSCELKTYLNTSARSANHILILGLGNRFITTDALGPYVTDKITVNKSLNTNGYCVSSLSPGVTGQTGLDLEKIIVGITEKSHIDCIIAIDALCTTDIKRLYSTVQMSDSGIYPGSGAGAHHCEISNKSIGVPVIVIGMPTVINLSSFLASTISNADISPTQEASLLLNESKEIFITTQGSDLLVTEMAKIIGKAINVTLNNPGN